MSTNPYPSDLPYLEWNQRIAFPSPQHATPEGLIAQGGNLSPGVVLSAYQQGCFPWYCENEPILWYNPDPRFVLYPKELHLSQSLQKTLRKNPFHVVFDRDFSAVVRQCKQCKRSRQQGTWITDEVEKGYTELFHLGFTHCVEVLDIERRLVGGLYGIELGQVFFGESMFSLVSNASKVGFTLMMDFLAQDRDIRLIDCQAPTAYLRSFGARLISRKSFLQHLDELIDFPGKRKRWEVT